MRLAGALLPRGRGWTLARPMSSLDTPNQASARCLESRERAATSGERTGQSSSGLDEGRSWYHLKHCNWVLGSTSTMPRRPTDGCPSAGAAVLRLMDRGGVTSRTNDNWNARCNGLMRSREAVESTARGVGVTPDPRALRYVDKSPIEGVRDANWLIAKVHWGRRRREP